MLAEFSIVPLDKGASLSAHVARMLDLVDRSGLAYLLTPMGTMVEGDADAVWDLVRACHREMAAHSGRVLTTVRVDDKKGATGQLQKKVASVERKLGRSLRTTAAEPAP